VLQQVAMLFLSNQTTLVVVGEAREVLRFTLHFGSRKAADLVVYDLNALRFGGFHDPAVAPVVAGEPVRVRYSIVNGRVVVDDGVIPGLDLERLRSDARQGVRALLD